MSELMNERQRSEIIKKAEDFFKNKIIERHISNTRKLSSLSEFTINPFIHKYLAQFAYGDSSPKSMAKALVYPRVLGTSIATTFGTQLQYFCHYALESFASTTQGIDIEFVDVADGRKKYCQVKAGPNTINHDDITTIKSHFVAIKHLARTNRVSNFNPMSDCVIGVFYGTNEELSQHYRTIKTEYPVYVGEEFWERLTGDSNFYNELIDAFAKVASEMNSKELLDSIINSLAKEIEEVE